MFTNVIYLDVGEASKNINIGIKHVCAKIVSELGRYSSFLVEFVCYFIPLLITITKLVIILDLFHHNIQVNEALIKLWVML